MGPLNRAIVHWTVAALFGALAGMLGAQELSGDSPQWGGSSSHNNVRQATAIPEQWEVGEFDAATGAWKEVTAKNIKWCALLGSQTYGNPIIAGGKVFVGTNNGAGWLKRYPKTVDLGCLLCFRESDGKFLWQHSSEKLATGRVHDWPMQGVCSAPIVQGDRLWFVTNRGEVVCLDTEGFYDGEDDGPVMDVWSRVFEIAPNLGDLADRKSKQDEGMTLIYANALRPIVANAGIKHVDYTRLEYVAPNQWFVTTYGRPPQRLYELILEKDVLRIAGMNADSEKQLTIGLDLLAGLDEGRMAFGLRLQFKALGVPLPDDVRPTIAQRGSSWTVSAIRDGVPVDFRLELEGLKLVCYQKITPAQKDEADVVWSFNMMRELGVSQHNMANCSPTIWGDTLFICTSNGVDESHVNIPAPEAPSFLAMDKQTGKVLWTDKSPGTNILHGQWSSPTCAVLGGRPQVLFAGGDGWLYSFDPAGNGKGGSQLLWKFDCNPKESKYVLGGRGTRNEIIGFPMIYDDRIYIAVGQDPEHGEGIGHLWCIDPRKLDDVSPELVYKLPDLDHPIPHRKLQAAVAEQGEVARPNPNSAMVWRYDGQDLNGNGKIEFEEQMHRSVGTPAIKDGLLYIADFSGLIHCVDAQTGVAYWTDDLLAACWSSALVVGNRVYIGDEDGDVKVFEHGRQKKVLAETQMNNSIWMAPVVANNVLFVATKSHLFAIAIDRP